MASPAETIKWRFLYSATEYVAHAFPPGIHQFESLCKGYNILSGGPWCIANEDTKRCLACNVMAALIKDKDDTTSE